MNSSLHREGCNFASGFKPLPASWKSARQNLSYNLQTRGTRYDGAFLSIIFVTYEQLCASNDRIHSRALAMACSRYAEFYRADFDLTDCKCIYFSCIELFMYLGAGALRGTQSTLRFTACDVIGFVPDVGCCEGNEPHQTIDLIPHTRSLAESGKLLLEQIVCCGKLRSSAKLAGANSPRPVPTRSLVFIPCAGLIQYID